MIIQPSLPYGVVIFCDDIREEINGKLNFVGVYENGMNIFGKGPVLIRQIAVWISLRNEIKNKYDSGKIKIIRSDNDIEIYSTNYNFPPNVSVRSSPIEQTESQQLIFSEINDRVTLFDLYFDRPCRLKVRAFSGDNEIRIGSLHIDFQEQ